MERQDDKDRRLNGYEQSQDLQIAQLLDALPRLVLNQPSKAIRRVRRWSGDPGKAYNGFSDEQRTRQWQLMWWLLEHGALSWPTHCSICGVDSTQKKISYHSEDYYNTSRMCPVCQGCHTRLHQRIKHPESWRRHVGRCTTTGNEWFCYISTDAEPDIAAYQRARYPGWDLDDLYRSPLFPLPAGLPEPALMPLPANVDLVGNKDRDSNGNR